MPQTSSSGMSHRQVATVFHSLMVTFMVIRRRESHGIDKRGTGESRKCQDDDGTLTRRRRVKAWVWELAAQGNTVRAEVHREVVGGPVASVTSCTEGHPLKGLAPLKPSTEQLPS